MKRWVRLISTGICSSNLAALHVNRANFLPLKTTLPVTAKTLDHGCYVAAFRDCSSMRALLTSNQLSYQPKRTTVPETLGDVVIIIAVHEARTSIGASERLLNSTINTPVLKKNPKTN